MHAGDVNRTKRDYHEGLERLDQWLRRAEGTLSTPQKVIGMPEYSRGHQEPKKC